MPRCVFPAIGEVSTTGNRTMTKTLALATSIAMMLTISGQALAKTGASNAWHKPETASLSAIQAVNAFDRSAATEAAEPNAFRYHGGPKYND